jgi:hypothetical protein
MFVKINGEKHYLWRAVAREGEGEVWVGQTMTSSHSSDSAAPRGSEPVRRNSIREGLGGFQVRRNGLTSRRRRSEIWPVGEVLADDAVLPRGVRRRKGGAGTVDQVKVRGLDQRAFRLATRSPPRASRTSPARQSAPHRNFNLRDMLNPQPHRTLKGDATSAAMAGAGNRLPPPAPIWLAVRAGRSP